MPDFRLNKKFDQLNQMNTQQREKVEFLLYYMTRPEYQIHVREKIYLDNMLDLFRTSARPNIDNKDYIGYY